MNNLSASIQNVFGYGKPISLLVKIGAPVNLSFTTHPMDNTIENFEFSLKAAKVFGIEKVEDKRKYTEKGIRNEIT